MTSKLKKKTLFKFLLPEPHLDIPSVQGLGAMRGKIDLDFEISKDPYTRHR